MSGIRHPFRVSHRAEETNKSSLRAALPELLEAIK